MNKKNVLIILTDQQRKDSLGCYGNPIVQTPNLDRLAKGGIRFNRCYVANPICMPNRLSIFTGMYPRNHGLWTNGLLLENERKTMAHELCNYGYQTASFGKIHFTPIGGNAGNMECAQYWKSKGDDFDWYGPYWGFEHVELTIGHTLPLAHYGRWFRQKGGTNDMFKQDETGATNVPPELHDSTFVAERTINFIRNKRDKTRPFFVVASFPDPHHPFNPPKECAKKYNPDNVIRPVGGKEDLKTRPKHYMQHFRGGWHRKGAVPEAHPDGLSREIENQRIANTYAMIDLIDQNVGKILDCLEEENLMEDTIVVFTSDHGELLGDHGLWTKGPFFYEGLINVPFIISARGSLDPGISDGLISSIDIFPTIMDLLDLPVPEYVNGVSQKQHLLNREISVRDKCIVEYRNGYGLNDCSSKVLITKDKKYVRYQTGECELTDLQRDPEERENVAGYDEYKEVINQMNEMLLDEILSTESRWPKQISHA